jgi:hypothetical protein
MNFLFWPIADRRQGILNGELTSKTRRSFSFVVSSGLDPKRPLAPGSELSLSEKVLFVNRTEESDET